MSEPVNSIKSAPLWRVWLLPGCVLAAVLIVFALGKAGLLPGFEGLLDRVGVLSGSSWALPILIGIFCLAAFLGLPQFVLFGAAIVAFGPWLGMAYAWLATLCSGALTFWAGRFGGEAIFNRFAGARAQRLSAFLGRNTFKASLLVRLVPTGPFILVNMAFGISKARFLAFLGGLAIGALPKLALVALAARGLIAAEQGVVWMSVVTVLGVGVIWGGMIWLGRRKLAD